MSTACIAHNSLEICRRCKLSAEFSATPENPAAFWTEEPEAVALGSFIFKLNQRS
jgi:hypothetical protein